MLKMMSGGPDHPDHPDHGDAATAAMPPGTAAPRPASLLGMPRGGG